MASSSATACRPVPTALLREYVFRHTATLTIAEIVDDPIYLEERFIRTADGEWDPQQHVELTQLFEAVDELGDKPLGWVPFFTLGTRHTEFGKMPDIPYEATRGGRESIYPEYVDTIKQFAAQEAAAKTEAARAAASPPARRR